ncbi:MAG: hypothetical protein U1A78_28370 [Polyangia bacterium]
MSDLLAHLRAAQQALSPLAPGFFPPDSPPNYTPYACSYHWFRGPDGRAISLDVIRSDGTGHLGLRVVRERADGGVDGLSHITPRSEWAGLRTDGELGKTGEHGAHGERPLLARAPHAIAGAFSSPSGALRHVRFALTLHLEAPGFGTGQLPLHLVHPVATDFPRVRYRGFVEINDEHLAIDALGSISLHAGDRLPQYAYLITVPQAGAADVADQNPALLLGAVQGDMLRVDEELLGERSLVYAYGRNGLPPVSLSVGAFGRDNDIPLGLGSRIELRDVRPFFHDFLGEPTCTASAQARYVPALGAPVALGRVFLDYRGAHFLRFLGPVDPHAATGQGGAR